MEWMLMPLKRYAEFGGRSRRQEFWLYMLLLFVIWVVAITAVMVMGVGAASMAAANPDGTPSAGGLAGMFASMGVMIIIFGIIWLALLIPTLAVQVRRLHDGDRSGWWIMLYWGPVLFAWALSLAGLAGNSPAISMISVLFSFISWIGGVVLIVFWCLPGTSGPNKFGPDPLGGPGNLSQTFQ